MFCPAPWFPWQLLEHGGRSRASWSWDPPTPSWGVSQSLLPPPLRWKHPSLSCWLEMGYLSWTLLSCRFTCNKVWTWYWVLANIYRVDGKVSHGNIPKDHWKWCVFWLISSLSCSCWLKGGLMPGESSIFLSCEVTIAPWDSSIENWRTRPSNCWLT